MNQSSSSDPVGQSADTNRTQITGCVDDSLRTRIAAVFEAAALRDAGYSGDDLFRLADAVIRELQLTVLGDGIVVGVIHE